MIDSPGINDLPPCFSEVRRKDAEIAGLRSAGNKFADWIDDLYGSLPKDRPPGPPVTLLAEMRAVFKLPFPIIHEGDAPPPEGRPQDPHLDGRGWRFETLEHGGAEPDTMPNAIRVTDPQGRTAVYVFLRVEE